MNLIFIVVISGIRKGARKVRRESHTRTVNAAWGDG